MYCTGPKMTWWAATAFRRRAFSVCAYMLPLSAVMALPSIVLLPGPLRYTLGDDEM
ncbi:hypothetical protein [Streptomyces canus]|uniref:Uncharacterized protein n=1 Tax=Streptomyces canus TaxID=58343 RepID=A0AAW8FV05_9ACTN|nr:hypothetical protein [Streptomyces canus]MDQ0758824.1 hypothetical protein [Streptomyces canus]MDQ0912563.1 hypothetical protein [Streptomyces canus]